MEELEELIEDADRDGSGSVDFQVTMLFIVLCVSICCLLWPGHIHVLFWTSVFLRYQYNILIWLQMYEYEVELNLEILTLT